MTFLRNHDELTLEMVTPEVRQWMWEQYAPEPRMRLNLGIRRRLAPLLDKDKQKWFLLHAMFLSLPGTPIIYYGDEIGMGDNIWLPDRHGCRTPMQWDDSPNAGFSSNEETYQPVLDEYPQVNVAAQEEDPDSYLNLTRFLLRVRQGQAALRRGEMAWVKTGNTAVLAFTRRFENETVLCIFNLSDIPQHVTIDPPALSLPVTDLLHPDSGAVADLDLDLQPRSAHWFVQQS